jgi:type II secretory pathway pseudopilin PulG
MIPTGSLRRGFSLVEVVIALGVIAFAVLAIVGIVPIGMQTGKSAQNDTRAAQIAQDIFAGLSTQARTFSSPAFLNVGAAINQGPTSIGQPSPSPTPFNYNVNLARVYTYTLGADNDGNLKSVYTKGLPYLITMTTTPDPAGFAKGYACLVSLRIAWPPFAQSYRDFNRIITRY